jgi:hypothetical protein
MMPFTVALWHRFGSDDGEHGADNIPEYQTFTSSAGQFFKTFVDAGTGPGIDDTDVYNLGHPARVIVWIAYVLLVIVMANLLIAVRHALQMPNRKPLVQWFAVSASGFGHDMH